MFVLTDQDVLAYGGIRAVVVSTAVSIPYYQYSLHGMWIFGGRASAWGICGASGLFSWVIQVNPSAAVVGL